jgi:tetratricopeptide (TPR) repeat protein
MRKACSAALLLLAVACATYTSRMELSRDLYYNARYDEALANLDKLVSDASDRDHYLLLLERGKVNLAAGRYDSAIVDLQAAERRFLDIEATTSVAGAFKSMLLNPTMGEYESEAHEKIMISSYLLLAYWLKGDSEDAFVERNRLVGRLEQYTDGLSEKDRAALDVPFARYLAAVMYEIEGRADDARIEYEAIARVMPEAVPVVLDPALEELVVFAEIGRAPVKVSTEIRGYLQKDGGGLMGFFYLPGDSAPQMFALGGLGDLALDKPGVLFTFAFPRCIKQERIVRRGRLVIDGVEAGEMSLLDDLEATAYAAYEKDLGATLLKAAFRTYLKTAAQTKLAKGDDAKGVAFNVLGKVLAAVDRADTRSWQTLPAEIAFYRMECPPGKHTIQIRYFGEGNELVGASKTIELSTRVDSKSIVFMPGF